MRKLFVLFILSYSQLSYSQNWQGLVDSSYMNLRYIVTDSSDNTCLIGGNFDFIETITYGSVAKFDGSNFYNITPNFQNFGDARCGVYFHGEIYIGGTFGASPNINSPYIVKYDGINWIQIGATGSVINMSVINNELYVVGSFDSIAGIPARYIAKYDGTTWQAINFDYIYTPQIINCIQSLNGDLYIGGSIDQISTGLRVTLLKYNSQTMHWEECVPLFGNLMTNISNMYVYKNELYLAGNPPLGGTGPVILRYDGDTLKSVGGGLIGNNPRINSFCEWDDKLVCAGFFNKAGIIDADGLAFWDGVNWCTIPSSHGNEVFSSVGVYQDTLYIAGTFAHMEGDSTVKRFAKWLGGKNYTECTTTSVHAPEINQLISISPNPTSNILKLSYVCRNTLFKIVNITGSIVMQSSLNTDQEIEIGSLTNGIYFLQTQTKDNTQTTKFIKQ